MVLLIARHTYLEVINVLAELILGFPGGVDEYQIALGFVVLRAEFGDRIGRNPGVKVEPGMKNQSYRT